MKTKTGLTVFLCLVFHLSLNAQFILEGPQQLCVGECGYWQVVNVDGQPVQGFSGVQFAPGNTGAFWFLSDNGKSCLVSFWLSDGCDFRFTTEVLLSIPYHNE